MRMIGYGATAACLALCATALTSAGTMAAAETYRAATWLPSNDIHTVHAFNEWAETVSASTGETVAFDIFPGAALLPARTQMQGVADGIAQVGFQASGYLPSELPVANALSGAGFLSDDPMALAFAFADFAMTDPMGQRDYRERGVIPVGGFSTPLYHLICNRATIRTLDDLRGKRIRFPGGQGANLGDVLGIISVNIPSTDIYTGLTQGQLDCTANDLTYLTGSQKLLEVSDSVNLVKLLPSFNSVMHVHNPDFWAGLSTEERGAIFDATARAMARLQIDWERQEAEALQAARDAGHEIIEPDPEITATIQTWVDDGVGDMAGVAASSYGIEDPDALFASFESYLEKWTSLVDGLADRHDEAEVTALLSDNLFAPIDPATYGQE